MSLKNTLRNISHIIPDKLYLKLRYQSVFHKRLDLKNPKTFNEKLQWLKLYDRKPEYTDMVDKYEAKKLIAERIGEEYVIPTLGVWDSFDQIDFDSLPDQFVLKCTHDSGGLVICRDKAKLDMEKARRRITSSLNRNYFWANREWPYKNIKPRIIAEKYMTDTPDTTEFTDYKFYCFNGKADCVMCCLERSTGTPKFYFFNKNWELLKYNRRGIEAPADFTLAKPEAMDDMFRIAELLSKDIPHVRVDLYVSDNKICFGEWTFFSESGFDKNLLYQTDLRWGSLLDLELVK